MGGSRRSTAAALALVVATFAAGAWSVDRPAGPSTADDPRRPTTLPDTAIAGARPPVRHESHGADAPTTAPDRGTEQLLGWAVRRYELAGLTVPEVVIRAHDDRAGCRRHVAVFLAVDPVPEIHLCFDVDAPQLLRRRVVLHEIAHAWTHVHLTDDERAAFLRMRGLDHWRDPARWFEQGTEHAAEIIAWGLLEIDVDVLSIAPNDRTSLHAAFRLLTGVDPICAPPPEHAPPTDHRGPGCGGRLPASHGAAPASALRPRETVAPSTPPSTTRALTRPRHRPDP